MKITGEFGKDLKCFDDDGNPLVFNDLQNILGAHNLVLQQKNPIQIVCDKCNSTKMACCAYSLSTVTAYCVCGNVFELPQANYACEAIANSLADKSDIELLTKLGFRFSARPSEWIAGKHILTINELPDGRIVNA